MGPRVSGKERTLPYGKTDQGDRLFVARRRVCASQEVFAERAGLKRVAYRSCEAGLNQMTTGHIRHSLAKAFDTDPETLGAYLDGTLSLAAFMRSLDRAGGARQAVLERALGRLTLSNPKGFV